MKGPWWLRRCTPLQGRKRGEPHWKRRGRTVSLCFWGSLKRGLELDLSDEGEETAVGGYNSVSSQKKQKRIYRPQNRNPAFMASCMVGKKENFWVPQGEDLEIPLNKSVSEKQDVRVWGAGVA